MSLGSSPLSKAGLPPVITGCLLNNKPPDSGERLAHTQGPRQCGAQSPFCPRAAQPHTPADPGGAKGVTHLCNPCDLHTLPGYNCRRPGQQTSRGGGGDLLICPHSSCITVLLHPPVPTPGLPLGFPRGSAGKESACNVGDTGSIPALGRSPGEGKDYTLQDSGLENSMDCIVHGVTKSQT